MFAYCLNSPAVYSDSTGSFAHSINPNYHCYDAHAAGGGGGLLITLRFLESLSDTISQAGEWCENQKAAITAKLTQSLDKAVAREYRTEYEEHHLVARRAPNAAKAATILNNVLPGGVEDPLNKVLVKTSVHRRLHTNLYYTFANSLVINAYYTANGNPQQQYSNVVSALGGLRVFVESLNVFAIN